MSTPALALRPVRDGRPAPDPWFPTWTGLAAVSPDQPPLRLVDDPAPDPDPPGAGPAPDRVPVTVDLVPSGAGPERTAELTELARSWAPWFAQLLIEALDGRRPLESLGRWLDEWVLAEVSRRVRLLRRSRTRTPGATPPPAVVVSLRTQFTHPRVLEVAVHVRRGPRSSGWAFQLVRSGERWRCTALALDPVPTPQLPALPGRTG